MSQPNIADTDFLERCIDENRSFRNIYEPLGLYTETVETRKEPVFVVKEANDLHKEIKEIAGNFKRLYKNERDKLKTDLVQDGMFSEEVHELGERYGETLWSRTKKTRTSLYGAQRGDDELTWDKEGDRNTIRYYLRCWITRSAVQISARRTGTAQLNSVTRELSESEYSDVEHPEAAQTPSTAALPLPFRAPEVPTVVPRGKEACMGTTNTHARVVDGEVLDVPQRTEARSPVTPNKRKAMSFQGRLSSGKLQKVVKDARANTGSPQARRGNVYELDGPMSPPPQVPLQLSSFLLTNRGQRDATCDSDRTWAPTPTREGTAGHETELDPDEVMADTQAHADFLAGVQIASDGESSHVIQSPTAGPSGTYRNPQRQDSVIPPSTQQGEQELDFDQTQHPAQANIMKNSEMWRSTSKSTLHVDVSKIGPWQEKQLRMELFMLLVSYLNNINEFTPNAYKHEAEERMNNLLYQFWINDADLLRSNVDERFPALGTAWERWMNMRHVLSEFQRTSGYFGKPGDGWLSHLKRMDRVVDRAKASIAFVELKSFANTVNVAADGKDVFDEDLLTVFDSLTQVEGCLGVEAFEALRSFNEGLFSWFL